MYDFLQCFSVNDLLSPSNCTNNPNDEVQTYSHLLDSMLNGECLLPTSIDFNDKVIQDTDVDRNGVISQGGIFSKLKFHS